MIFSQFTFYYLAAILIQLLILRFIRKEDIGTRYLHALTIFFLVSNAIIFGGFLITRNVMNIEILVRFYYATSSLSAACLLSHAIEVCNIKRSDFVRKIETGVWLVALCCVILSIFTDEIISGQRPRSFTATAIQGDLYWVFRTQIIMAVITAGVVLVRELSQLRDRARKMHCLFMLIAYLVTIFSVVIITALMHYGIEINFDTTFPFFTTFSLSLIVYGDFKYGWLGSTQPIQKPHKVSDNDQLGDIFTKYTEGKLSFNEATEQIDLLLVNYAYNKHSGNMLKTAQAIGLGRSTLYKKVQKHKLK